MQTPIEHAVYAQGFYIKGITHAGELFRPSDWIDRLCGIMAHFAPKQVPINMSYSHYVQPVMLGEMRVVRVDPQIAQIEPKALSFLIDFVESNHLQTVPLSFTS